MQYISRSGLPIILSVLLILLVVFLLTVFVDPRSIPFMDDVINFMAPFLEPFLHDNEKAIVDLPNPIPNVATLAPMIPGTG